MLHYQAFFCIIVGKVLEFKGETHATLSLDNVTEGQVFIISFESWQCLLVHNSLII
jgi:hypothetical protein